MLLIHMTSNMILVHFNDDDYDRLRPITLRSIAINLLLMVLLPDRRRFLRNQETDLCPESRKRCHDTLG